MLNKISQIQKEKNLVCIMYAYLCVYTPVAMGNETPCWRWCASISQGQSRWQSSVYPSLIPGLVAKVVLCPGHIKIRQYSQAGGKQRLAFCYAMWC